MFYVIIQVEPAKYKNMRVGFPICLREERWRGMYKGWTPTLIGYSLQGCFKFGLYEVFKILYSEMLGEVGWLCVCVRGRCKLRY